ncbi:unnamed protein product [Caenorhabditis auriculariae]|uniref:Uncharacterized protein n=1 Tax=Caenorhabditis auriculariae TaxID=2777116 RepID=A0A8S1GQ80_9PELO|nr:unnamed protein product [Caenorhabditis auriculariae]
MLHISHAQRARNAPHRQSVLDFRQEDAAKSWSSENSSSSSSRCCSSSRNLSYNCTYLQDFLKNNQRTPSEDVGKLRGEVQDEYYKETDVSRKRECLLDAIALLNVLKEQTVQIRREEDTNLAFFLAEYQNFVYWVYSTIRFSMFMSEMERHFQDLKDHHRVILSSLKQTSGEFLTTIVRFSFLCLEFAEICDEEALHWCRSAHTRYLKKKGPRRSDSSISAASTCSDPGDQLQARRDADHERQLIQDLRNNVQAIELAITLNLSTKNTSGEKLID